MCCPWHSVHKGPWTSHSVQRLPGLLFLFCQETWRVGWGVVLTTEPQGSPKRLIWRGEPATSRKELFQFAIIKSSSGLPKIVR